MSPFVRDLKKNNTFALIFFFFFFEESKAVKLADDTRFQFLSNLYLNLAIDIFFKWKFLFSVQN